MGWRELNPLWWGRRLHEEHHKTRRHHTRNFTAAELRYLRRTAAPDDLRVLRDVVRRNLGRT